ncbi:unnamed protein product [Larinioides sclopetarius]|uniref:Uncharacterized protein n=1 Tax=Larinioides sclopetarius TaxID=280406 RepID=A0AAV1YYA0_9ARAC
MAFKLLMISAVLLVLTWQSEAAFITNITLEDGLRLEADNSAALSITKTTNISSETDGQLNEVAIWTDPHADGKCPRPNRLLADYLKQLRKSVYGSFRYTGFISADAFISMVGVLSAIVILVLPAAANAIGFKRSGVKTPSWASLIQTALFGGQISGKSGLVYSRLQSIGRRGSLNVMDQLFVTSVCAVIVFSYVATILLCKVVHSKICSQPL